MADLVILEPAQRELEQIAQLHMNLVGPNSARKITNRILDSLSRLEHFPLSGSFPHDKDLRALWYRYVITGKYICVYRLLGKTPKYPAVMLKADILQAYYRFTST